MLLEVGRIARAHGLRGEVIVELSTNVDDRVRPGAVLRAADGRSFEVVSSAPHGGRWIVAFAGVADRTEAERLQGTPLLAEAIDGAGDTLWVHLLIGAAVVDTDDRPLGTVTAVEANPASDLLVLDSGGLVPLRFVVSTGAGRIVVDPPAGLLDL